MRFEQTYINASDGRIAVRQAVVVACLDFEVVIFVRVQREVDHGTHVTGRRIDVELGGGVVAFGDHFISNLAMCADVSVRSLCAGRTKKDES